MRKLIISIIILIVAWLAITFIFKPAEYLFPSFFSVINSFNNNKEVFLLNTLNTLTEVIVGFIIANIIGLILAIMAIYYPKLEQILTLVALILKTVPIIAIAPLLVLWFGHGIWSKIAAVTLSCFIPIFINIMSASKNIEKKYKELISLYNLNNSQKIFYFILPGLIPYLLSAFKISSSLAIVGALVSEFISANKGLGYLIISNYYSMNIEGVFVCIIISSIIGIILYNICDYAEKRIAIKRIQ